MGMMCPFPGSFLYLYLSSIPLFIFQGIRIPSPNYQSGTLSLLSLHFFAKFSFLLFANFLHLFGCCENGNESISADSAGSILENLFSIFILTAILACSPNRIIGNQNLCSWKRSRWVRSTDARVTGCARTGAGSSGARRR